jgi:RNA polymerase-binding transcription factor DksA
VEELHSGAHAAEEKSMSTTKAMNDRLVEQAERRRARETALAEHAARLERRRARLCETCGEPIFPRVVTREMGARCLEHAVGPRREQE